MDLALTYERCVCALKRFVTDAGFSDVVIGLSGGIDSSLVSVMAVDALGCERVHGVLLPGPYSSDHSITDAHELASCLDIATSMISIVEPYEAFALEYEKGIGAKLAGLASENTQARLRMMNIMALSNAFGWMMLNTGNKSEAAMGYSTLYGDTAGAFAPIGGVYKTDVYRLARWVNDCARLNGIQEPIPKHVLTKPASAELSPHQNDEASMGITYEDLDSILKLCLEEGLAADAIERAGFERSLVDMVLGRYEANAFKRKIEPPFVDVYGIASLND